ncbi:class I glutamine amidotransferase-like protein [Pilobolus umbonatus]|nr:class I glutamine amidotransferase-like protein [Pilobolus umbonatus]
MTDTTAKKVIVCLTDGAEEMEFTITVDILRRARLDVTVVGVDIVKEYALCSRGVKICPDVHFKDFLSTSNGYDAIVIPGGLNCSKTLAGHKGVKQLIMDFYNNKKIVAFICAGTLVAKAAGIPVTHKVTSYPGAVREQLVNVYNYSEERVVVDDNVITSRGPGTSFLFALTIVEQLLDVNTANSIKKEMLTAPTL